MLWSWLGGAALCALIAATRIVRFERLLRDTLPASERLQRLASEIAGKLGVRRVPDVRYVECVEVPLLWFAGSRPTIVLPMRLLSPARRARLGPDSGPRACPLAATRPLGAHRRVDRFDRLLVESAGVAHSAADSPGRGPLLRRVGPLGISRLHEALCRSRAQDGGVAERVAGRRAAAAGQSVSAFPFAESED